MKDAIRVVLVEEMRLVRGGLVALLMGHADIDVVGDFRWDEGIVSQVAELPQEFLPQIRAWYLPVIPSAALLHCAPATVRRCGIPLSDSWEIPPLHSSLMVGST